MAQFNSVQVTQNVPGPGHGLGGDVQRFRFTIPIPATFAINDTLQFGIVPAGFRIHGAVLLATDMDTGGPTVTIDVGDGGFGATVADPDRIFAASTVAGTGTYTDLPAATCMDFKYLADTMITGLIKAAATTPAAGTLTLILSGVIEGIIATP